MSKFIIFTRLKIEFYKNFHSLRKSVKIFKIMKIENKCPQNYQRKKKIFLNDVDFQLVARSIDD